jgi:hypothetical protein
MLDAAKQLIKIISKVKFINENSLGFVCLFIILELAIIIRAAIRILKMINVDDMVSIDENDVINVFI